MPDVPSVTDVPVPAPAEVGSCAACPHALADHDRIALRFCQASQVSGTTRGCVCSS